MFKNYLIKSLCEYSHNNQMNIIKKEIYLKSTKESRSNKFKNGYYKIVRLKDITFLRPEAVFKLRWKIHRLLDVYYRFKINWRNRMKVVVGYTEEECAKLRSENMSAYSTNYNFLRILSGMSGLVYSN